MSCLRYGEEVLRGQKKYKYLSDVIYDCPLRHWFQLTHFSIKYFKTSVSRVSGTKLGVGTCAKGTERDANLNSLKHHHMLLSDGMK